MRNFFNQNSNSNFKHQKKIYQQVFNTKGLEDGDEYLDSSTPNNITTELEEGEEASEIHGDGVLDGCTGRLSQLWLLAAGGGRSKQPVGGGSGGAAAGRRWSNKQGKERREKGKDGRVFAFFCFPECMAR